MRWDDVFADLEGQLAAAGQWDREAQVAELVRAEQGAVALEDRLRGQGETPVHVMLTGGLPFRGTLGQISATWFILESAPHSVLVPLRSVVTVAGLGRRSRTEASTVRRTRSLASALRTLARDRALVTCFLESGHPEPVTVIGTIDTVGADYLEVMPVHGRSRSGVSGAVAVPFGALIAVRSVG